MSLMRPRHLCMMRRDPEGDTARHPSFWGGGGAGVGRWLSGLQGSPTTALECTGLCWLAVRGAGGSVEAWGLGQAIGVEGVGSPRWLGGDRSAQNCSDNI